MVKGASRVVNMVKDFFCGVVKMVKGVIRIVVLGWKAQPFG